MVRVRYQLWKIGVVAVCCLAVLLAVVLPAPVDAAEQFAAGTPMIRVLLSSHSSSYAVTVEEGEYALVTEDAPQDILQEYGPGSRIVFHSPEEADGFAEDSMLMLLPLDEDCLFRFNGLLYRGGFQTSRDDAYYAVNLVDVEQYLYGVVGYEIGYDYSLDATAAQAVAARSYALASIGAENRYYDVTNTVSSQVYGGYSAETAAIRAAVDASCGYVVMCDDEVVQAYYCSNAGGHTENIENVWYSDEVPLRGVDSSWDALAAEYSDYGASCYSWTVTYSPSTLVRLANAYGDTDIGTFEEITVYTEYDGQSSVSGRAMSVTIQGSRGSVTATKDNIRSLLDLKSTLIQVSGGSGKQVAAYVLGSNGELTAWEKLSDLFATGGNGAMHANGEEDTLYVVTAYGVEELDKEASQSEEIIINGWGYGHGVGMSQWGAIAMGDAGYSWEEIIEHYYCSDRSITLEQLY